MGFKIYQGLLYLVELLLLHLLNYYLLLHFMLRLVLSHYPSNVVIICRILFDMYHVQIIVMNGGSHEENGRQV